MGRDEMRAADADRHAVADKLRAALDEGRLDLSEYDERLQQAYAAKTYGDLDRLLTDLPNVSPVAVPGPSAIPARAADGVTAQWVTHIWSGWAPTAAVMTAIWLVASLGSGGFDYYWPVWIIGPWGVVLLWQTIGGLATGEPRKAAETRERKAAEARERKALAKQEKRERKALEVAREAQPPEAA